MAGLLTSRTLAVPRLPWLASGGYEDWYLVGDFAALGVLNAAVMDREHVAAHDRVAEGAGDGAGGVYALVAGDARQEPGNVI